MFPIAKKTIARAIEAGSGSPAAPTPRRSHTARMPKSCGRWCSAACDWSTRIVAATVRSAESVDVDDRGRLVLGLLADVIAVPGDPTDDITVTQDVQFVMKGGAVYKLPDAAQGARRAR